MAPVNSMLKRIAAKLPIRWQQELKRKHFRRQIDKDCFYTDEKEYALLEHFVKVGDWVLDIGANIGHYTAKLSEITGNNGRVIAFEPVPETFELLAANTARFKFRNVTLINAAASVSTSLLGINIPKFDTGLNNYYMAHLTNQKSEFNVLCIAVDSLTLPYPVKLVKVDAEGHELSVLKGMQSLLQRDHPILIIEENEEVMPFLDNLGYSSNKLEGSSNRIFRKASSGAGPS